jgi:hypothetical protein
MSPLVRILRLLNCLLSPSHNAASRHDPDRDRALVARALRTRMSDHLRKDAGGGD